MLLLTREKHYADCIRKYEVYLDDTKIGLIANGKTLKYDLQDGEHTLQLKSDRLFKSPKITFISSTENNSHFTCSTNYTGMKAITAVFVMFFRKGKYIRLEQDQV